MGAGSTMHFGSQLDSLHSPGGQADAPSRYSALKPAPVRKRCGCGRPGRRGGRPGRARRRCGCARPRLQPSRRGHRRLRWHMAAAEGTGECRGLLAAGAATHVGTGTSSEGTHSTLADLVPCKPQSTTTFTRHKFYVAAMAVCRSLSSRCTSYIS